MPDYKYKPSIMIDDLLNGLKAVQKEAVTADKIIGMIGNKGNLNKLLAVFISMDNLVDGLVQDTDKLKSTFGGQLQSGFLSNINDELGKLSDLIKQTQKMSEDVLGVDLKKSNAATQLKSLATQLNTVLDSIGISNKIDLNVFNKQGLKEQRDEIIKYINSIGSEITLSVGKIDVSQLGGLGDSLAAGMDDAGKQVKKSVDKLSKEINAAIKKAVTDFYDAVLSDDSSVQQAVMKSLQNKLNFNNADFKDIKNIFKQLEDGDTEEDDAVKAITTIVQKIHVATDSAAVVIKDDKTKLVDEFKAYFHAIEEAIDNGIDVMNGKTTDAMNKIKAKIQNMLPNLDVKAQFDLTSIFEGLEYDDIGLDDIENEINNLIATHGLTIKLPAPRVASNDKDVAADVVEDAKEEVDDLSAALTEADNKTENLADSFKALVEYISNSGKSPKSFFSKLESGAEQVDDELKNILTSLKLIDENGNIKFDALKSGYTNKGGFVSDNYTMIARPIIGSNGNNYLNKSQKLQSKLEAAKVAGAQVGTIVDLIKDETNNLFYEIQNTVLGSAVFSHHNQNINSDVLKSTPEQLESLVHTIDALTKQGLFIDWGGDNVLYDEQKGFSIIDLGTSGGWNHTVSIQNTLQENVERMLHEMVKFAPASMASTIQSSFASKLYDAANKILPADQQIQYAVSKSSQSSTRAKQQATDATQQATKASQQQAVAVQQEEDAHYDNADAIQQENKALEAQIALKRQAQSMTWEKFALDESLSDLKIASGIGSLNELENFWKDSNYNKKIDFTELGQDEAKAIIESKFKGTGLLSQWFGSSDHNAKNKIENRILSDDELRNAAMNWLYHISKKYKPTQFGSMSFQDFLTSDIDVFRGDDGPVVYNQGQKLSFSLSSNKAKSISGGEKVEGTKIKPMYTTGNVSIGSFDDELELWVPSYAYPQGDSSLYINNKHASFEDYYSGLDHDMQESFKAQLVYMEQKRVENLLGKDIAKLIKKSSPEPKFYSETLSQFQQGIIPDKLDVVGIDWTTQYSDQLAEEYNKATETQKRLIAYYAHLNSIDISKKPDYKHAHQTIGQTGTIDAMYHDPQGFQQFINETTGISKFGLFGQNTQAIYQEAEAHQAVAQAVSQEADAKKQLSQQASFADAKKEIDDAKIKGLFSGDFGLSNNIAEGLNAIQTGIEAGDTSVFNAGVYWDTQKFDFVHVDDLMKQVQKVEESLGINLNSVRQYLQGVYQQYFDALDNEVGDQTFKQIRKQLFGDIYSANDDFDKKQLESMFQVTKDVFLTPQDQKDQGYYMISLTGELFDANEINDQIEQVEKNTGYNLSYIKDYLSQVYSNYFNSASQLVDTVNTNVNESVNKGKQLDPQYVQDVIDKLYNMQNSTDGTEWEDKWDLYYGIKYSEIGDEPINVDEICALVDKIEAEYHDDLSYVKQYLHDKYGVAQSTTQALDTGKTVGYHDIKDQLGQLAFSSDPDKKLLGSQLYNKIVTSHFTDEAPDDIQEIYSLIDQIESEYAEDLSDIKQYLQGKYGVAQSIPEMDVFIDDDIDDTSTATQPQGQAVVSPVVQFGDSSQAIQNEVVALDTLQAKINDVINAVDLKTQAFINEENGVQTSVANELAHLKQLEEYLEQLKLLVNGLFDGMNIPQVPYVDATEIKAPVDNQNNITGGDWALETTLKDTNSILELIFDVITDDDYTKFASSLDAAVEALKNAANAIAEHKKQQKSSTKDAGARIADATTYKQISDIAKNAAAGLGSEVQVDGLTALKDGIVKVDGAFKNAEGVWEAFSVKVNTANEAVDLATKKQSAFAKSLNEAATKTPKPVSTKKAYGQGKIDAEQTNYNKLSYVANQFVSDESPIYSDKVKTSLDNYAAALDNLKNKQQALINTDNLTDEEIQENKNIFDQAQKQCEIYRKELEQLIKANQKFKSSSINVSDIPKDLYDLDSDAGMQQALTDYVDKMYGAQAKVGSFDAVTKTLSFTIKNADGSIRNMTAAFDATKTSIGSAAGKAKQATSVFGALLGEISSKSKHLFTYFAARFGVDEVFQQIRQGIQYVREIDAALTELKKVTDETTRSYEQFKQTASSIAAEVGSTMSAIISSTADWARLGYNIEEATTLAKNTSILMSISEFDDINKATDTVISALQAFKTEGADVADLSMEIINKYNEIGNSYAISTADLADSLTRSSASLVAAGNSLSESIALTTSANTVLQNPEAVGTMLKTLAMRIRGTSATEIAEAGLETDGLIQSASKLASKIQELTSIDGEGGIKILTESGDFKSTYQILLEISKVWHEMDDIDQAALLEIIAGKRAGSGVAAILSDTKLLQDVFESAENAGDSAMDELEKHMKSMEGTIQGLTNTIQTFWSNFLDDEAIKFLIKALSDLIKFADKVGGIGTLLGGFVAYNSIKNPYLVRTDKGEYQRNDNNKIASSIVDAIKSIFSKDKQSSSAPKSSGNGLNLTAQDQAAMTAGAAGAGAAVKESIQNLQELKVATDNASEGYTNMGNAVQATSGVIDTNTATQTANTGAQVANTTATNVDTVAENANTGAEVTNTVAQETNTAARWKNVAAMIAQAAKAMALNIAMTALQAGAMMLAGILINKVVTAIQSAAMEMKHLKEEAVSSAKALEEDRDSLSDYKDEVAELRKTLADNNASEQEAYDARVRLMQIQDELIDKYGSEARGINLVTGALEKQIEAIDKLDQEAARDYVTKNSEAFSSAQRNVEKKKSSSLNLSSIADADFKQAYQAQLAELGFSNTSKTSFDGISNVTIEESTISGTRQEIADAYNELADWVYEYAETHPINADFYINQISTKINDLGLDDEEYKQDLEVYNAYLENKAIGKYTDVYGQILDEQGKYNDAIIKGDLEAQQQHRSTLLDLFSEANTATEGDSSMQKYFADMKAKYEKEWAQLDFATDIKSKNKKTISIDGQDVEVDIQSIANTIKGKFDDAGATVSDILNIGDLLDAEAAGKDVDWTNISQDQINAYKQLAAVADVYGLEVEDLLNTLNQLGYIKMSPTAPELTNIGKSVDMLSSSLDKYQTAMDAMQEITYDNMQVSEEYYTALRDYIGDSAELNEAFYTENGEFIVTNAKQLEKLIKQKQKDQAADVKRSKAQARLRYYDLFKQMQSLTKGHKKLTGAALAEVKALYAQMGSIEQTIAKYSILEAQLLGVANAYTDLDKALAADESMDYGGKAENMVNVLANAFNTAELGSEAAQVAIRGLVPEEVIDKTKTLDEQMQQIYSYFSGGPISKLFTIEFSEEGEIESVEMTKENIESYVNELLKTNTDVNGDGIMDGTIFQGTWDEFTLNPAIQSLEDFQRVTGQTKEVAFAFLTSLEKYDIGWLGDNYATLLDQLMSGDIEYQLYDKMQKIADLEMKFANGSATDEDTKQYGALVGEMETLEQQTLDNALQYTELSNQLDATKQKMADLNKELAETDDETDKLRIKQELDDAGKEASDLIAQMNKLDTPTEFTLQVASDEAQEKIDDFKNNINALIKSGDNNAVKIKAAINEVDKKGLEELGLTKNPDGSWSGLANITGYSSLDETGKQEVVNYLNLINGKHTIDAFMGEGLTTVEEHLNSIVKILEQTYTLMVEANVDDSQVVTFREWLKHPWQKTVDFVANWFDGNDGSADVNGTAHARGTAFAGGNWGAPNTETALVGELGPEMVVRGNRWFTVGDNGAEFTDIKKGDIIFNHKQTEDLLSKGHVTGRGKAYASGTAYKEVEGLFPDDPSYDVRTAQDDYNKAKDEKISAQNVVVDAQKTELTAGTSNFDGASINTFDDLYKKLSEMYGNKGGSGAGDKDDAEELIDFIEIKLEEIEHIISKTSAELTNKKDDATAIGEKDDLYNTLVAQEGLKAKTYHDAIEVYNNKAQEFFNKIPKQYRTMAKNGALAIEDFIGENEAEHAEAINNYREWAAKAHDAEVGELEAIAQQAAYRVEQLEDIASDYENLVNFIESGSALIEANISLMEEFGAVISPDNYKTLIDNSLKQLGYLQKEKADLERELQESVNNGDIIVGTDEWYEAKAIISDVDQEIVQCREDIVSFANAMENLRWDALDRLMTRLEAIDSQLAHLFDRFTDGDIVDEAGNWTSKGIAALGVSFQRMESAQAQAQKYADEIAQLDADFAAGLYEGREEVYYAKREELTEKQWDAIEAIEAEKDAIIDLNKERIEAIKEGIEEEIEAYKELTAAKKESLQADKDSRDFERSVQDKQKEIDKIDRKLAALAGDNSASAAAQRKKLQEERAELQADLDDLYYDRSVDNQIDALDKSEEEFEKSKEAEKEALEAYLDDEEQVIADSLNTVKANTTVVLSEIQGISSQYGIQISTEITKPWTDGQNAINGFSTSFNTFVENFDVSGFTGELQKIIDKYEGIEGAAQKAAAAAFALIGEDPSDIGTSNDTTTKSDNPPKAAQPNTTNPPEDDPPKAQEPAKEPEYDTYTIKKGDNLWNLAKDAYGSGAKYKDIYEANKDVIKDPNKVYVGQTIKIPKYAKGTMGVKNDEFAWIDEIGEELVLHADGSGKLAYLTKGSTVVPSDLTQKLIDLAIDPTQTLENSRPVISAPQITNNEINVNMEFGEVVHIDTVTNDTIPDLTKAIEKQLDKYMKGLNNQIRKYTR